MFRPALRGSSNSPPAKVDSLGSEARVLDIRGHPFEAGSRVLDLSVQKHGLGDRTVDLGGRTSKSARCP
eukprot:9501325-Alexandrium_andersonii.AAC.1